MSPRVDLGTRGATESGWGKELVAWGGHGLSILRKQYHLQPTVGGFDAWDVNRLIDLSKHLPVIQVEVATIAEVDTDYWFNVTEIPTVRNVVKHVRLIEAVDPAYPIILGADGRVMDGMHRIARAVLEGRHWIPAVQFPIEPAPDYRSCSPEDLPYDA